MNSGKERITEPTFVQRGQGASQLLECAPPKRSKRLRQRERSGGLTLCVMVVLLLVGLISSQAIQTLLIVRRGDDRRGELRQARELLELGKLALQSDQVPESKVLEITVDGKPAKVRFANVGTDDNPRKRIVAQWLVNNTREVTVSWESPE